MQDFSKPIMPPRDPIMPERSDIPQDYPDREVLGEMAVGLVFQGYRGISGVETRDRPGTGDPSFDLHSDLVAPQTPAQGSRGSLVGNTREWAHEDTTYINGALWDSDRVSDVTH